MTDTEALAQVAAQLGFGDRIRMSASKTQQAVLEDVFEAVVGGLLAAKGVATAHDWVVQVMREVVRQKLEVALAFAGARSSAVSTASDESSIVTVPDLGACSP